jgi:hypothetical protein
MMRLMEHGAKATGTARRLLTAIVPSPSRPVPTPKKDRWKSILREAQIIIES